ncbi:phenylacetate--CoA ligase [Azorhizobium oxalatiphilum]|uniref:Phenylacetate--CoA ligase n=1 Tax=Azorhizobium oxalatiphilum TaxID=980631 RepID=A0A917BPY5_9HYPH|nr:AMP-binding protein [Azorhizobium oxalatiphilum]GGF52552.1 phenylacetate--CoA ligase [Azorhizobium oxalatiphilum]
MKVFKNAADADRRGQMDGMAEPYDARDTQPAALRLEELLRRTARVVGGYADAGAFDMAALGALPVIRKSALPALQAGLPPFGGLVRQPAADFPRLFLSPGPICEPQLSAPDGSNAARALHAAGFRRGHVVLNTFNYHLTPGGFLMDEAARALGCAVIPAGAAATEQVLQVLSLYQPEAYAGTADHLNIIARAADAAGVGFSIRRAVVAGAAVPSSLRASLRERGVALFELYGTAELGIIAYETSDHDGLVVNEDLLVEILDPATGARMAEGDTGEIVVTRPDARYPLVRFATGDLSAFTPGAGSASHTAQRLRGWLGRADQAVKVKGMFVVPAHLAQIRQAHPEVVRARFVISRADERDVLTLEAEAEMPQADLEARLARTLRAVTRLGGTVCLVPPGSLGEEAGGIVDKRRYD